MRFLIISLLAIFSLPLSAQKTVDFSIDKIEGCEPLAVKFTDNSGGGSIIKRTWNFGDGAPVVNYGSSYPAGESGPGRNYLIAGNYKVTLTVEFADHSTLSASHNIKVYPLPKSDFEASSLEGCKPLSVNFTDKSTSNGTSITEWVWNFGSGSPASSGVQNPSGVIFNTNGNNDVFLYVVDANGCKSNTVAKKTVRVYDKASPSFSVDNEISCTLPFTANFTNLTTGPGTKTYLWNFGDGTTSTNESPSHTYNTAGVYNVSLTVTNGPGCSNSINNYKTIRTGTPKLSPITVATIGCSNSNITFNTTCDISYSNIKWTVSDGTTTTQTNGGTSFTRSFTPGTYTITAQATSYGICVGNTQSYTITIKPKPIANFTIQPSIFCNSPYTVSFTNTSTVTGSNVTYTWNYGDGTTATNPAYPINSHNYTTEGYKYITLTVTDNDNSCTDSKQLYVGIVKPQINATVVPVSSCEVPKLITGNVTLQYLTEPVQKYIWNFNDGPSSVITNVKTATTDNASYTYNTPGIKTITIKAITNSGCELDISKTVTIADECEDPGDSGGGGFGASGGDCNNKGKFTFTDAFSANTTNKSKVVSWDFGDGTIVNTQPVPTTILHTYTTPVSATYTVKLTREYINSKGQTKSEVISQTVEVVKEVAKFTVNKQNTCTQVSINFIPKDINSAYVRTYEWDFDDGNTATKINYYFSPSFDGGVSHMYGEAGSYTPKLKITDKLGCVSTYELPLPIEIKGPEAKFSITDLVSCKEAHFTKTVTDLSKPNGSVPIERWEWYIGSPLPGSPTVVYDASNPMPNPVQLPFENNTNAYKEYSIKLVVKDADGCESKPYTLSQIVKSYWPVADFYSNNLLQCNNYNVYFYSTSRGKSLNYTWDFGDGTPSSSGSQPHSYAVTGDGVYTIKLDVSEKDLPTCTDSKTRADYVTITKPVADFEVSDLSDCAPTAISFYDRSSYPSYISSYKWDFGDGSPVSTEKNPNGHIYAEGGDYDVTLTITGLSGCVASKTIPIHIKGPSGKFSYADYIGCAPFKFTASVNGKNVSSYSWDFLDGKLSPDQSSVTHTYTDTGLFKPNVVLFSSEGCKLKLEMDKNVIVDGVKADFSIDQDKFCNEGTVNFIDKSTVPSFSSITNYLWTFGDGTTFNGKTPPPHNYTAPGKYKATVKVISEHGHCESTADTAMIIVNLSPTVKIDGDDVVCLTAGVSPSLHYLGDVISVDAIKTYEWKIDNTVVANTKDLKHDYRVAGAHTLTYKVVTVNDCETVITKNIIIDSVKAAFEVPQPAACFSNNAILVKNKTTAAYNVSYLWKFGDGITSVDKDPAAHTYALAGKYNITLEVTSENGCFSKSGPIEVTSYPQPSADISGNEIICLSPGAIPALEYLGKVKSDSAIQTYEWKIDNTVVANTQDFKYDFRNAGPHTLSFRVVTVNGCESIATKDIIIDSVKPSFIITNPEVCLSNNGIVFQNKTTSPSTVSYKWNFGDNTSSTVPNPVHTYAAAGLYDVILYATTQYGCSKNDTVKNAVKLYAPPVIGVNGVNIICENETPEFTTTVTSEDEITGYKWYINNTLVTGETNATLGHLFTLAGNYEIKAAVLTKHGCEETAVLMLTVNPVPKSITINDTVICKGNTVKLYASDGVKYHWFANQPVFDNGTIADNFVNVIPSVDTRYYVGITNQFGCYQLDSVDVTVNEPVNLTVCEDTGICRGKSIRLWAKSTVNNYSWQPGESLNKTDSDKPLATPHNTTTYTVTAFSKNVCPDEHKNVTVAVYDNPFVNAGPDTTLEAGQRITFQPQVSDNVAYFNWLPHEGLSCYDCKTPELKADKDITYKLTVTTVHGCSASDELNVKVLCGNGAVAIPNAFSPNGDGNNDVFYILGWGIQLVKSFRIYDRWGNQVFIRENVKANDKNNGWNGKVNGVDVPQTTTFVYIADIICNEGKLLQFKGTVILVK